ncbi:MAG: argininosuccinate synthase [Actinobacteria bacterium]|nr:argininosuccinate synthase [Actinomycetota bacterium]MCL6104486.1 argininosuccinate synthase [Actinomycetota bacterium]
MTKKIVLAYSGGLDTSVAVRWLIEEYKAEVIAVAVDVGQNPNWHHSDWEALRERSLKAGAAQAIVVDAKEEFARDFIMPALAANALYEGQYPLVSALSRPLIAKYLVEEAGKTGADAIAHGSTAKGNDQVRFELSVRALNPRLEVLAPARTWGMTRAESIEYANRFDIPIFQTATSDNATPYSIDENLWGRAIECGILEDPWQEPPEDIFSLTGLSSDLKESSVITVGFEQGIPVSLQERPVLSKKQVNPLTSNDEPIGLVDLITKLTTVIGMFGWGRIDMVENRRVGIKSREVYECPAALALIMAHKDLESLVLERDLLHFKESLEQRWAELVYDGMWYSPLKEALDQFFISTQRWVTGRVKLRLSEGRCVVIGRDSPSGMYDMHLATYGKDDTFRHQDAEGFVRLWGLGLTTWATAHPPDTNPSGGRL